MGRVAVEQHATPAEALLQVERIALLPSIVCAKLHERAASLQPAIAAARTPAAASSGTDTAPAAIGAEESMEHEAFLAQAASALLGTPPV